MAVASGGFGALVNTAFAQDGRFFRIAGPVPTVITQVTANGFVTWTHPATNAAFVVQSRAALLDGNVWRDHVRVTSSNAVTTRRLFDPRPPAGMVFIPAGEFTMGDTLDGSSPALPAHPVYVSAFYMDKHEVTQALWDEVYSWAITHGYSFDGGAAGKAADHPAHSVTWYDAVKWCNARSEQEGVTPAYYTSAAQTAVFRTGQTNVQNDWVKWHTGYRLPTEAEWEKAARGGPSGGRFPWGDTGAISHTRANYYGFPESEGGYDYDLGPMGYHAVFQAGDYPYTAPVGFFAANGYGLHDLAGNVLEWCWDWYDAYSGGHQTDARGPVNGSLRVLRGGSWYSVAFFARCADRISSTPLSTSNSVGFRCVRGS